MSIVTRGLGAAGTLPAFGLGFLASSGPVVGLEVSEIVIAKQARTIVPVSRRTLTVAASARTITVAS